MRYCYANLRTYSSALAFFAPALLCLMATPAAAQVRVPAEALAEQNVIASILEEGAKLEAELKWGEALTHYEKALKSHPRRTDLKHRVSITRAHWDLGRRYKDSRFVKSLSTYTDRQLLDVYSEVLLKVHAHYVHEPDWRNLAGQGLLNLEVAARTPKFRETHMAGVDVARVASFLRDLRQAVETRPINTRHQAREMAAYAGKLAVERLNSTSQPFIMEFVCGALGSLDTYSSFLTASQLDEVMSQIEGNFVGLGIELKAEDKSLRIVNVIAGGPAAKGGLKTGEHIMQVDGKSMDDISTDTAADMLKGLQGTTVELAVRDTSNQLRTMRLTRDVVEVPSVEGVKIIDKAYGIGYLKISSFQKTTSRDVDTALWSLHRQGMRTLVIDVRGNPGGLLTASVEVADKFVMNGVIVSTRGRSPREDFDYKAHTVGTWRVPLTVLIDGNSASASEIFAGAIHDHRRGKVVGQRSYGKGSVQGIFPLNLSKAGVRLTTAKFYSPSGQAISNSGVEPDLVVRVTAKPATDAAGQVEETASDATLNAALQLARKHVSQR